MRISTTNKSVEGIKPVNKIRFNQELQRAVNSRWRSLLPLLLQALKDIVCSHGLMAAPDELEDSFSLSGESQTTLTAYAFCVLHRLLDTRPVVVLISWANISWECRGHLEFRGW